MRVFKFASVAFLVVLMFFSGNSSVFGQFTGGWTIATPIQLPVYDPKPFDRFDADSDGSSERESIINSYLLSHLSMAVYGSHFQTPAGFQAQMEDELLPQGVEDVEVFVNYLTGTEGAIVWLDDAIIVAFRGTSTNGILLPRFADHIGDINTEMNEVTLGGRRVRVHSGFWNASGSVYPGIRDAVQEAHAEGKKVWITGHSLGGANATLTAARLHAEDNIPVQGLETFGTPRVGDYQFKRLTEQNEAGGYALEDVTQRWVLKRDPIPTFFLRNMEFRWVRSWTGFNYLAPYWVYYHHISGQTHNITRNAGIYNFQYDSGEQTTYWDNTGFTDEHMDYKRALRFELEMVLVAQFDDLETYEILSETF